MLGCERIDVHSTLTLLPNAAVQRTRLVRMVARERAVRQARVEQRTGAALPAQHTDCTTHQASSITNLPSTRYIL